jgi:hypothetical protein
MKNTYRILVLVTCIGLLSQCADDGEYDHPIAHDNKPATPVLFTGGTTFGANPYYSLTMSSGVITINITIPDSSPRSIAQITQMSAGTTALTPGNLAANLTNATVARYITAPIAVNAKSATITTSIAEFNSKFAAVTPLPPATTRLVPPPAGQTVGGSFPAGTIYAERAFMFNLMLDDGTSIITQQVRIRVTNQ